MIAQDMLQIGNNPSCIRQLFEFGAQRAKIVGRENVFDYSLGNPSIPAPPEVNAAIEALLHEESSLSLHGYTTAFGDEETRRAIANDLNDRYQASLRPQNFFITGGAAPAVTAAIRALRTEQAEFLAIAPYFPEYKMYVEGNGAQFTVVPADTASFQIDFDALRARISPYTQAVLVNSPNNPSGVVYTRETLKTLARLLTERSERFGHPIYIIADEPYRELVYDGTVVPFIPAIYPNTIVCYSYSKSLSLPGERIGYACVPDGAADSESLLLAIAGAARACGHVCAPSLMQKVVARCVSVRPDLGAYDLNRVTLYDALVEYGYRLARPQGAFYLFVEAPGGDSAAFSERAKAENLLLVPGNDFGCSGYFRLSTCVSHEMILKSLPTFQQLIAKGMQ